MKRYGKVTRCMWGDAKFRRLSAPPPNGRSLWLFLLTCEEASIIPGVIRGGEAAIAEANGWELKGFREAFGEVFREGLAKADWKARLVWLPRALEHNAPQSPNVVLAWGKAYSELPDSPLKAEIYQSVKAFLEAFGEGFREAFGKAFGHICPNQDQDQDQDHKQYVGGTDVPEPASAGTPPRPSGIVRRKPKSAGPQPLPADWSPRTEDVQRFAAEGWDALGVVDRFRDHWAAEAGKPAGKKSDWNAAFRNWVRKSIDFGECPEHIAKAPLLEMPPPSREDAPQSTNAASVDLDAIFGDDAPKGRSLFGMAG